MLVNLSYFIFGGRLACLKDRLRQISDDISAKCFEDFNDTNNFYNINVMVSYDINESYLN